jgi:hypothetical protein
MKRLCCNFKVLSQHSHGETKENHENLSQGSWYPGWDSNPGPPEYKARVLTSRPWRWVWNFVTVKQDTGHSPGQLLSQLYLGLFPYQLIAFEIGWHSTDRRSHSYHFIKPPYAETVSNDEIKSTINSKDVIHTCHISFLFYSCCFVLKVGWI